MKTSKRNIKFLTGAEVRQLINSIPVDDLAGKGFRDRALLEVLFSTGLRISEALALKRVDLDKNPTETLELDIIGKGGWQRTIYVSPVALHAVLTYFEDRWDKSEMAFPMGVRAVQIMIKRRAKQAGIDKFISPHVMRHSFATNLLNKGVNIYYVQEFMGHRALSSTSCYLHVINSTLKKIHKDLYETKET